MVINTNNVHANLEMSFCKAYDSSIMTVYIKYDIYIQYIHMIQSNNHSSIVWSTRDITPSQQGWRYPEGPVVQC